MVLDQAAVRVLPAEEAICVARKNLEAIAKPEDTRSGTRPADIKRYLKSLLKERSDLVLIGRLLVIRPVRHLVRGVLLGRTSDKRCFRVWRYLNALYDPAGGVGYGGYIHEGAWQVWQPHFEPLLIDSLAQDIFDHVGGITTLGDFAAHSFDTSQFLRAKVTSLVLAGERERAAEYVQAIERDSSINGPAKRLVQTQWALLARDIDTVCAEFHAKEAATVKALKLDPVWEPSPFPVEVSVAERASVSAEPFFITTPWISRPPWLLEEVPSNPGDIRFAKELLCRDGRVILLVPLTPRDAEERHRVLESYTLVARLPDDLLLVISHSTGWDRNEPRGRERPLGPAPAQLHVELHGSSHVAAVSAAPDRQDAGFIHLRFIDVYERLTHRSIWHCSVDLEAGERGIHDSRTGQMTYARASLTPAERDLVTCPMPAFGEYAALGMRFRSLLQSAGYGAVT